MTSVEVESDRRHKYFMSSKVNTCAFSITQSVWRLVPYLYHVLSDPDGDIQVKRRIFISNNLEMDSAKPLRLEAFLSRSLWPDYWSLFRLIETTTV